MGVHSGVWSGWMVTSGEDLPRQEAQALDSGETFGGEGAQGKYSNGDISSMIMTDFDGENKRGKLNFLRV